MWEISEGSLHPEKGGNIGIMKNCDLIRAR